MWFFFSYIFAGLDLHGLFEDWVCWDAVSRWERDKEKGSTVRRRLVQVGLIYAITFLGRNKVHWEVRYVEPFTFFSKMGEEILIPILEKPISCDRLIRTYVQKLKLRWDFQSPSGYWLSLAGTVVTSSVK